MKCGICGGINVKEYPNFDGAEDYGDFHHVCQECGAIGYENFGHGVGWNILKSNLCDCQSQCIYRKMFGSIR